MTGKLVMHIGPENGRSLESALAHRLQKSLTVAGDLPPNFHKMTP